MSMIKKIATAGAVAAMGLGLGAASASAAYDLTGGDYHGIADAQHTFTVAGAYTISCDATFSGNTENDAPNAAGTKFTPAYSNCDFFGFDADVTINAPWTLEVTSHSGSRYFGSISIPAGTGPEVVIEVPLIGCEVYVDGAQTFAHGAGSPANVIYGDQVGTTFELNADVYNISYTTNGLCPFGSGGDGEYHTNAPVTIDGVSVDIV